MKPEDIALFIGLAGCVAMMIWLGRRQQHLNRMLNAYDNPTPTQLINGAEQNVVRARALLGDGHPLSHRLSRLAGELRQASSLVDAGIEWQAQ